VPGIARTIGRSCNGASYFPFGHCSTPKYDFPRDLDISNHILTSVRYLIPQLSDLLKEWMAPKYVWSIYRRKFITHEANWRDLDDIGRWWPESGIGTKIGDSEESALVEDEVKNKARDKALNQLLGN